MSSISNDHNILYLINTYFWVASYIVVVYDWALTFGQEIDLVWRQRWSIVTILYLGLRYIGLVLPGFYTPYLLPIPLTNALFSCIIMYFIYNWESFAANSILGAIMIIRLYSMYRCSKVMLTILILIFSLLAITSGVILTKQSIIFVASEKLVFPDICQSATTDEPFLTVVTWILGTVWEILALCLAVRVAIKDLYGLPTGWTCGDCLRILIKSHVLYFSSFTMIAASVFTTMFPSLNRDTIGAYAYGGFAHICSFIQMFVLGPRLILSIREYGAKIAANSDPDEPIIMATISFQDSILPSAGSDHDV